MKTFRELKVGDILFYGLYDVDDIHKEFSKVDVIIGRFVVTSFEYIASKMRTDDDGEEYEFPVNDVVFTIEPYDDEAMTIIERCKNVWYKDSFFRQITVGADYTHSDGRGTSLSLFTTLKEAQEHCIERLSNRLVSDEDIKRIIEIKEHNEEQLRMLDDDLYLEVHYGIHW